MGDDTRKRNFGWLDYNARAEKGGSVGTRQFKLLVPVERV